jgi:NOL1/NOP2/fmu family ribosome biogenesis protein
VIVIDAPCSGSGLFRKDKMALDEWTEGNVQLCRERQERIVADVWPALKEEGILVYATCSYSPQEDEQLLEWLASAYEVETLEVQLNEEWGVVQVKTAGGMYGYRFFPDKLKGEGFFIAALRKKETSPVVKPYRFKSLHDKKIQTQAGFLLKDADRTFIKTSDNGYSAIMPAHEPDWQLLQKVIYFRRVGVRIGSPAREWIPEHDVALSIDACQSLPTIEVNREQALRYLKREEMGIESLPKGWLLVRYCGLGLGWIKSLGTRSNNYLPKHWRIRMELE